MTDTNDVNGDEVVRNVNPKRDIAIAMYQMKDPDTNQYASVAVICAEIGIQPPQLYKWLAETNTPLRSKVAAEAALNATPGNTELVPAPLHKYQGTRIMDRYSLETKREVARMYREDGVAANLIATIKNIPYPHVRRILLEAGVNVFVGRASDRSWLKIRKQVIEDIRNPDLTIDDITVKHAISKGVVMKIAAGVEEFQTASLISKLRVEVRTSALIEEVLKRLKEELKIGQGNIVVQTEMFDEFDAMAMQVTADEQLKARMEGRELP